MRGERKEVVTESVLEHIDFALAAMNLSAREIDIVVEDFALRYGQNVDITPMHTIGAIDAATNFENFKYSPGTHKNGNKAYNISKMIKDNGFRLDGDHKADALSLALHHFKIVDTRNALKFLEGYKK